MKEIECFQEWLVCRGSVLKRFWLGVYLSSIVICFSTFVPKSFGQNFDPAFRINISTKTDASNDPLTNSVAFFEEEEIQISVEIKNLTEDLINVPKGLGFSRPHLFWNGRLVPYLPEVRKQFEKGKGGTVSGMLFLKPKESETDVLILNDLYGRLKPGHYQLSLTRHFFKSSGVNSNTVLFDIVSCKSKKN